MGPHLGAASADTGWPLPTSLSLASGVALRKHLAVHEARRHGVLSLATAPQAVPHRGTLPVSRETGASLPEIRQTELEDQQRIKAEATSPACQTMVPRPRTHFEVFLGLGEESIPLSVLQRVYRLSPATLNWIWEYVESTAICHLLLASARSSALRLETFQSPAFHLCPVFHICAVLGLSPVRTSAKQASKQAKKIFLRSLIV